MALFYDSMDAVTVDSSLFIAALVACQVKIDTIMTTGQAINNLVRLSFFSITPTFVVLAINDAARDTDTVIPFKTIVKMDEA
jgi:hypothetical protein